MAIAQSVKSNPKCVERLEHMLSNIQADEIAWVSDDELDRELITIGHRKSLNRLGLRSPTYKKQLIAFSCLGDREELHPGYPWLERRSGKEQWNNHGVRCQTALEIQSAVGCPFDCSYCPYGSFLNIRLDVEAIVERITNVVRAEPHQTLFKLNNRTDTLGLEPEYGLAPQLIRRFAKIPGKYLLLYSKGTAVENLLDLNHQNKTVASWTLTPSEVQKVIEPAAPDIPSRLNALSSMAGAGYPIRVRFSPIVPIRAWEEAYLRLLRQLKNSARPEMITLWTLSMIEPKTLARIIPLTHLCPDVVESMERGRENVKGTKGAPFPWQTRVEIYRKIIQMIKSLLPSTRVAICLESFEVWDGLRDLLSESGEGGFHCNCGPRSTPSQIQQCVRR